MRRGCTVGTFDGVHRGHQLLIGTLAELCRDRGLIPTAITFDRHPLEVVAPSRAPLRLLAPARQQELLREAGAEAVVVFPFTKELAAVSARDWIRRMRDDLDAELLVLGYDNHFGHDGRALTHDDLRRIGREEGVEVLVAPELPEASSTAVRRALEEGDVATATRLLGRAPEIEGRVVEGQRLGRTLGFPTANLRTDPRALLPRPGVYAASCATYPVMLNIGSRPTVGEGLEQTVEAHVIGFEGDLYGRELRLELLERIRDERRFPSLEALKEQLESDRGRAIEIFSKNIGADCVR